MKRKKVLIVASSLLLVILILLVFSQTYLVEESLRSSKMLFGNAVNKTMVDVIDNMNKVNLNILRQTINNVFFSRKQFETPCHQNKYINELRARHGVLRRDIQHQKEARRFSDNDGRIAKMTV